VDSRRRAALTAGVLLITATVTNVVGTGLSRPLLNDPDRLARLSANAAQVTGGALLELVGAGASVGIAIALYPVLRQWSAGLALGAVVFRTIEAAMYAVAVAGLLALLALSSQFVSAGGTDRATLQAVGAALLSMRDQAGLLSVVAFCVGGLLYYWAFYQSGLIPRWLSGAGLAAVVLLLAAWLLALFTQTSMLSYVPLALPLAVQEMVLAVWLIVKGFTASAPLGAVQPRPPVAPRPDHARALAQEGHP
jgi:Domain of unknown function (DUF4386)